MNNRYLYHAKRTDNGEWVEGFIVKKHGLFFIYDIINSDTCRQSNYEVDQSTICQCTGLRDKNGKLIWENDIVSFLDMYSTENGWSESGCVGKVAWDDETISFQVTNRLSAESYEVLDECLVIGNIFDNTELLEVD